MKKKDLAELKAKNIGDLKKKIVELQSEKVTLILEQKQGKLKNVHEVMGKRKDIARLKTILRLKLLSQGAKDATS